MIRKIIPLVLLGIIAFSCGSSDKGSDSEIAITNPTGMVNPHCTLIICPIIGGGSCTNDPNDPRFSHLLPCNPDTIQSPLH